MTDEKKPVSESATSDDPDCTALRCPKGDGPHGVSECANLVEQKTQLVSPLEVEKTLMRIIATAGAPDAAEACRNIIKHAKALLQAIQDRQLTMCNSEKNHDDMGTDTGASPRSGNRAGGNPANDMAQSSVASAKSDSFEHRIAMSEGYAAAYVKARAEARFDVNEYAESRAYRAGYMQAHLDRDEAEQTRNDDREADLNEAEGRGYIRGLKAARSAWQPATDLGLYDPKASEKPGHCVHCGKAFDSPPGTHVCSAPTVEQAAEAYGKEQADVANNRPDRWEDELALAFEAGAKFVSVARPDFHAVRDAALEEAAQACDAMAPRNNDGTLYGPHWVDGKRIRALKSMKPECPYCLGEYTCQPDCETVRAQHGGQNDG